jgi:RNA polymerase sigma factor (sigma-70 family)
MSLTTRLPASLGDFNATPELDELLGALARRARHDPSARNALYGLLDYKIARFARRYHYRDHPVNAWSIDDVGQEAFLVFCEIVERWPGERSFLGYFFSRFPWRLSRRVKLLERGWERLHTIPFEAVFDADQPDQAAADALMLADIGAGRGARDRTLLELRGAQGMTARDTARVMHIHPRHVQRLWSRLIDDLRE